MNKELTISDAVSDPMIGLMLKADNVSERAFAQLLQSAARLRELHLNGYEAYRLAAGMPASPMPSSSR